MSELVLWLPKPPDIANGRQHWAIANGEKRKFLVELDTRRQVKHGIPPAPKSPIERASIAPTWCALRQQHVPDPDNAVRRLKPAIDWLVASGYLVGDTIAHVQWLPLEWGKLEELDVPAVCTVRLVITPIVGTG